MGEYPRGVEPIIRNPYAHIKIYAETRSQMPKVPLVILEGNEAVTKIAIKGRSPALRHVHRTHRVNCDWLYEVVQHDGIHTKYANTKYQLANMLAKAFTKLGGWKRFNGPCQIKSRQAKQTYKTKQNEKATTTRSRRRNGGSNRIATVLTSAASIVGNAAQ